MKARMFSLVLALLFCTQYFSTYAQTPVKKVLLQGFWWDYYHNDYADAWADYLVELSPRLKELGIDGVWIPPSYKNDSPGSVGYAPFDHYDLGDKYQKSHLRTRVGTKDELLRLVAVMHANGMEVIQDIVLNHVSNAGGAAGQGGQDPEPIYSMQTASGYKNFRYASYGTPVGFTGMTDADDYLSRSGRWPKNYHNFHPHAGHNVTSGDWESSFWGPDFCYGYDQSGTGNGYGTSTNATCGGCFNPIQASGYSRDAARDWIMWFKKQTAVDGFRWDAVKHFPYFVQQDLSYNCKYVVPAWAQGGSTMTNFGEYVGGKTDLDNYVDNVTASNGGSEMLMGSFDFNLRAFDGNGGLYGMVYGFGGFDMSTLPAAQQDRRYSDWGGFRTHRTASFINNHDTFRPQLDASGNIIGWNSGDELSPHIDPTEPRLSTAYAVIFAMDGTPVIFFEDLFDLTLGNRFTHDPTNYTELPVRDDLLNLIWCHQNLGFKDGDYLVRDHTSNGTPANNNGDHLVIERSGQAIIGINDNWNTWQNDWVDSNFPPGTVLKDYSGANGTSTVVVQNDQRVNINTPPVDPSLNIASRHGYSVWAPIGQDSDTYTPSANTEITQEWELSDDLGDSHCNSLGQGGAIPANSCNVRVAGRVLVAGGSSLTYRLYPTNNTESLSLELYDDLGFLLTSQSGTGNLIGSYSPANDMWVVVKARNSVPSNSGQTVFVNVSYTAPDTVDTDNFTVFKEVSIWSGNGGNTDPTNCQNWENGLLPQAGRLIRVPSCADLYPVFNVNVNGADLIIESGASLTLAANSTTSLTGDFTNNGNFLASCGTIRMNGTTQQNIYGTSTFCRLELDNPAGLIQHGAQIISQELAFLQGSYELNGHSLSLNSGASISNPGASRFVITDDDPLASASLIQEVNSGTGQVAFPIGLSGSYTPVYLSNSGTSADFAVRVFSGVLNGGDQGGSVADPTCGVLRSWEIAPTSSTLGLDVDVSLQWNLAEEGSSFDRSQSFLSKNAGGGSTWNSLTLPQNALGSGPFTQAVSNVSDFSFFKCVSCPGEGLAVELSHFEVYETERKAQLQWTAASESENQGFFVMKSRDGVQFNDMAFVPSIGTHEYGQTYYFEDPNPFQHGYYQLRMLDLNGKHTFSVIRELKISDPSAAWQIVPNPVQAPGSFQIQFPTYNLGEAVDLEFYDLKGRKMGSYKGELEFINKKLGQSLDLAPGMYMIRLSYQGKISSQKLLILL